MSNIFIIDTATSSTDFLVTSIIGQLYLLNNFLEFSNSFKIFSSFVYSPGLSSCMDWTLFLRTSCSLVASQTSPITQAFLEISIKLGISISETDIDGCKLYEGTEYTGSDYDWFNFMWVFIIDTWTGERKLRKKEVTQRT